MLEHNTRMQKLIDFAREKNPIWPFACMILDAEETPLIMATDCAHISPLYHAESLALHILITRVNLQNKAQLTLISTSEPDTLSQSAIHWSRIVRELNVEKICYGSTMETIQRLWPFCIDIKADEIVRRSSYPHVTIQGGILESTCDKLFQEAKARQQQIDSNHPGALRLSNSLDDFYQLL